MANDSNKTVVRKEGEKTVVESTTQRDDGGYHKTTSVDIPNVGSIRSSYDWSPREGYTGQHITNNDQSKYERRQEDKKK